MLCYCSLAHLITLTIFGSCICASGKQFSSMSNRMCKAIFLQIYVLYPQFNVLTHPALPRVPSHLGKHKYVL